MKICLFILVMVRFFSSCCAAEEFFPDERNALIQLREIFSSSNANLHGNWTGPPCYKNQSRWAGIGCSNSHVTRLVLEGLNFKASIPPMLLQNVTFLNKISFRDNFLNGPLPNLSNLLDLEFLFLSNNHFSGSIPVSYAQLPKLTQLELQENSLQGPIPPFDQATLITFNVSHNQLSGPIPETAALERFPKSSYEFNSELCGTPIQVQCQASPPTPPSNGSAPPPAPESRQRSWKIWSIVFIAAAASLIFFCIMLFFRCCYRRINSTKTKAQKPAVGCTSTTDDPERKVELEFFDTTRPFFDLDDLLRASAEVIGRGKLGTTYKAMLECGLVVAVKRLKDMNDLSSREFNQQLRLLGKLRHQNLVQIISFYYSKDEKLVIYEHVPQGNLFQLIHENRGFGRQTLNWKTRVSIIKDIAKGLNFLHQSLTYHRVPHGNLKSSNVLLQHARNANPDVGEYGYYNCKLTDYGLLSLLPLRKSSQTLAVAKSPEFCQGKRLTEKADIYCFGVVVLEIITGKTSASDNSATRARGGYDEYDMVDDLSEWVRTVVNSDWSTDILDLEILAEKEGYNEMLNLTNLALECTDAAPEKRPKMNEVLRRIEEVETT